MKAIIVNETKEKIPSTLKRDVDEICNYLSSRRLRNGKLLSEKSEITIVFLTAPEMKRVNSSFRKKNKPTDILSFASDDPASIGELLLCPDVLKKQAAVQQHTFSDEMKYMLIHGILHLLGYDHELSKSEEKLMFSIQDKAFGMLVQPPVKKSQK